MVSIQPSVCPYKHVAHHIYSIVCIEVLNIVIRVCVGVKDILFRVWIRITELNVYIFYEHYFKFGFQYF